jgi:hypothetical protein
MTIGDRTCDLIYEPPEFRRGDPAAPSEPTAASARAASPASDPSASSSSSGLSPADAILRGLRDSLQDTARRRDADNSNITNTAPAPEPAYSAALSRALCYLNKLRSGRAAPALLGAARPRVLLLTGSADVASQYVPVMNAVFAAQRGGVPVDICLFSAAELSFLQQASQITGEQEGNNLVVI